MSHTLPAPMERVPLGTVRADGSVVITPEWLRYLSHALPRQVVATADQADTLTDMQDSAPTAVAYVQPQEDAPGPDAQVQAADDAPADVAALRAELDELSKRLDALELK